MNVRDQSRSDQTRYRNIKGVLVVGGYHYGCKERHNQGYTNHRHGQIIRVPYINAKKEYNFRITKNTHNLRYCKVGHTASVMTKFGKRNLVISKVLNAIGSKVVGEAMNLKPVVNFHSNGLTKGRWGYLYQTFIIGGAKPIKQHINKKFKIYFHKPERKLTPRIAIDGCDKILGGLSSLNRRRHDGRHLKLNGQNVWRVFKGTDILKLVDNVKTIHVNTGTLGDYNSTSRQLGQMKIAREWTTFLYDYLKQLSLTVKNVEVERQQAQDKINAKRHERLMYINAHIRYEKRLADSKEAAFYREHPHIQDQIKWFKQALIRGGYAFNDKYNHIYFSVHDLRYDDTTIFLGYILVQFTLYLPYDMVYYPHGKRTRTCYAFYFFDDYKVIFNDEMMMNYVAQVDSRRHNNPKRSYHKALDYIKTHSNAHTEETAGFQMKFPANNSQSIAKRFFNYLEICRKGYRLIGLQN